MTSANTTQIGGSHYKGADCQPWDFIESNSLGYLEGNIIKYITRWREKDGVKDLYKAHHYAMKLLEVDRANRATPLPEEHPHSLEQFIESRRMGHVEVMICYGVLHWQYRRHLEVLIVDIKGLIEDEANTEGG